MIYILIIIVLLSYIYIRNVYLKDFIEMNSIYKSLCKLLDSRDLLILKILPDVKNEKIQEKVLNLINKRRECSKISYDSELEADVELNNDLKILYDKIDKMNKNELQLEIFKKIISLEKQIKSVRLKYNVVAEKYNMSLTVHPKFCVKFMKMKPIEIYGSAKKNK